MKGMDRNQAGRKLLFVESVCLDVGGTLARSLKAAGIEASEISVQLGKRLGWLKSKLNAPGSLSVRDWATVLYALGRKGILIKGELA